jgi:glutamyl-tRNA reductase
MASAAMRPKSAPLAAGEAVTAGSPGPRDPLDRPVLLLLERRLSRVGLPALEASVQSLAGARVRSWFQEDPSIGELVALPTCQRFVLLALLRSEEAVPQFLARLEPFGPWERRQGPAAARQLFRLTSGLESIALGEREIREQVRHAAASTLSRWPRPILRRLLARAVEAAERFGPSEGPSVADLAADWLGARLPAAGARVLVIGAGTVGRRVAEALVGRAGLAMTYRRRPPPLAWRERFGVRTVPFTDLVSEVPSVDAVVAAAKTTGRVLLAAQLPSGRRSGPRWFVDLGVPRNIDPELRGRPGVDLVDLEGLGSVPRATVLALESLEPLDSAAESAYREVQAAECEAWVAALHRYAEVIRREEWGRALRFSGPIPASASRAFERLSGRLVRRLLSGATREMRAIPVGREYDVLRRRLLVLFAEASAAP